MCVRQGLHEAYTHRSIDSRFMPQNNDRQFVPEEYNELLNATLGQNHFN